MSKITQDFPIVGIGASAGGLKAIKELLHELPSSTNMAFIIVQHLSRKFKSLMKEILAKDTKMPVIMAENEMLIEPNHLYLIPAGYDLTIQSKTLNLVQQAGEGQNFVIDKFLHSLGMDQQASSIAIILSGTGTDGSRGIRTVKESGGIVIVQEPNSGEFDGMPLSAIDTHIVDFILTPREIADKLKALSSGLLLNGSAAKGNIKPNSPEVIGMANILELVHRHHDLDFSAFKPKTIERRLSKHMALHSHTDINEYYRLLISDLSLIEDLYYEFLIGVTEFFRDKEAYQALEDIVMPKILSHDKGRKEIRIWVCACSTGEEVYSLAILLHQYAEKHKIYFQYTILATDVNDKALTFASKGHYPPSRLNNMSEEIIDKYFTYNGQEYEVNSIIRENIIFARNDATVDPPFINLDFVSCRNLLIYLEPHIQRKLLLNFHFGLNPGGFLWLGNSENILDLKQSFNVLSEKWKVFSTQGETPKSRSFFSLAGKSRLNRLQEVYGRGLKASEQPQSYGLRPSRLSYAKLMLDKYAPPSILIDNEFTVVYIAGGAGRFLQLPDMELSRDILRMVSQHMVITLRDGLKKLQDKGGPLLYSSVRVSEDENIPPYSIYMESISPGNDRQLYLIEWRKSNVQTEPVEEVSIVDVSYASPDSELIITELQSELNLARQEIQDNLEELETSNEELQAANEELLASNEELQSTNEELQSVNEELYTVNAELQTKNKELQDANNNIDNLLANIDIGTLFLNKELHIKMFTQPFREVLSLDSNDIDTHIDKFKIRWNYPTFLDDVEEVIRTGKTFEKQVVGPDARRYFLVRIHPYPQLGVNEGVIINLIDISKQKKTELDLQYLQQTQEKILKSPAFPILLVDREGFPFYVSTGWGGFDAHEIQNDISALFDPQNMGALQSLTYESEAEQKIVLGKLKVKDIRNKYHDILLTVSALKDKNRYVKEFMIQGILLGDMALVNQNELSNLKLQSHMLGRSKIVATVKDEQFRYVYINEEFIRTINKPQKAILGNNDSALYPEEIAVQLQKNDEWVLNEQRVLMTTENYIVDEQISTANVLKFPIQLDGKRKGVGCLAMIQPMDFVEAKGQKSEVQEKLSRLVNERTEALIQSNTQMRTIARSMAHDLRAPLRAIHTFGEMLKIDFEQGMKIEELDRLTKILRQSSRMNQIIESLLAYLKLGNININMDWVDIRSVALNAWEDLSFQRIHKEDKLLLKDCPAIWADHALMKQIITNLFSNSLKYRKREQAVQVEIGAYREKEDLIYFIKDDGVGFEGKDANKIFDVFERLFEAEGKEGHGLGLSIVKQAINLHGGQVWAQSQLGQGATFFFKIPPKIKEN